MKASPRQKERRGGLELVEEAVRLLGRDPVSPLAAYYTGSLPFILAIRQATLAGDG